MTVKIDQTISARGRRRVPRHETCAKPPLAARFCLAIGLLALMPMLMTGCAPGETADQESEPELPTGDGQSKLQSEPQQADDDSLLRVDGLLFDLPAGWRRIPLESSQMSFISAKVAVDVDGEELTASFSTVGGGIDANITRWQGQFAQAKPDIKTIQVAGRESRWVDIRGDFRSDVGNRPGPIPNWRMLGVAIPMGRTDFYIKLTGPRDKITEIESDFRSMVLSGRSE